MTDTIGCGVIGLGLMGRVHARIWQELPTTHLVAVHDIEHEKADELAESLGASAAGDLQELAANPEIEIVSVCTDDQSHVEPCVAAAAEGKHVLVEKPLATTTEDADRIIEACERAGVKLMPGHCVRFDARYALARESVASGEVGEIVHVFARRNNITETGRRIAPRTSVAFFLGIHDIDAMRWVTGADVVGVYSEGSSKVLADVSAYDSIFTLMKLSDGSVGCLETCWVIPEQMPNTLDARLEVVGTEGRLAVRVGAEGLEITTGEGTRRPDTAYWPIMLGEQRGAMRAQLEHFARCVLHDRRPLVSSADGRAAVAVGEAIHQSLESGRPVDVAG